MTLLEMFDKVKPKTQDLDTYVYFDSHGLIYDPNPGLRTYVQDADDRQPGMTQVGDLSARLNITGIPEESEFKHDNFEYMPDDTCYKVCELQESFVQVINALASYGSTLFYTGTITCYKNEIEVYAAGLQYVLMHKSKCEMPDFSIQLNMRTWNSLYYLYQMLKDNKVKKVTYYNLDVFKCLHTLFTRSDGVEYRFEAGYSSDGCDQLFDAFKEQIAKETLKYIGKFDRKYINDSEKNVKLKHLIKSFPGDVEVYKCDDRLSIYQDAYTKLYFL